MHGAISTYLHKAYLVMSVLHGGCNWVYEPCRFSSSHNDIAQGKSGNVGIVCCLQLSLRPV